MMTFQNILTIYNAAGILEVSAFNCVSRPSVHRQHFGPVSQLLMPLLPAWWQSNNAHQCHVCTFYRQYSSVELQIEIHLMIPVFYFQCIQKDTVWNLVFLPPQQETGRAQPPLPLQKKPPAPDWHSELTVSAQQKKINHRIRSTTPDKPFLLSLLIPRRTCGTIHINILSIH